MPGADDMAIYGFITWLPTMLLSEGLSVSMSMGQNLLIATGSPLGAAIGIFVAGRWGRRRAIVSVALIAAFMSLVFASTVGSEVAIVVGFAFVHVAPVHHHPGNLPA
ncbi:MAG: hypothetical protein MI755_13795 [Sphingomonadales bacterium]|nr:hypothetical protein [Sphingomonadales bacterium]